MIYRYVLPSLCLCARVLLRICPIMVEGSLCDDIIRNPLFLVILLRCYISAHRGKQHVRDVTTLDVMPWCSTSSQIPMGAWQDNETTQGNSPVKLSLSLYFRMELCSGWLDLETQVPPWISLFT
ncbi:hypothetical protein BGX38DRAFT_310083 [Terfezia claveryi]|nr:hypothetical protein BGX38DRAFT_310083 [Terfezia claveryi]